MNDDTVLARLTGIFHEVFDDPAIVLTRDTTADDVPGWDSMNHITLVVESERRFGVKFQSAELEELKNVGEFVDLITAKLARQRG
jgi:acyl carrier protein